MLVDIIALVIAWTLCLKVAAWNSHTSMRQLMTQMNKGRARTSDVWAALLALIIMFLTFRWGLNWLINLM